MLPTILFTSPTMKSFLEELKLPLNRPQRRHLEEVVEGLLVTEGRKTLTALTRQLVEPRDIYAVADFFRQSPWDAELLRVPLLHHQMAMICALLATLPPSRRFLIISIDEYIAHKPRSSKHFEPVDWHADHTEHTAGVGTTGQRYAYGLPVVTCRVHVAGQAYTVNWRPYLRERTVRRLNRKRPPHARLHFRSKFSLAREMLAEIAPLLPPDCRIYIVFDSWYASKKLIRFCLHQGWHVICDLKPNRRLDGKPLHALAQTLRHQHYDRVTISATDGKRTYYTRCLQGYLNGVPMLATVLQSRRSPADRRPKYLLCTDPTLSPREILTYYALRWGCEVDYLYLKTRLGLEDFRLRSVEAITKYWAVVFLALAFLQVRKEKGGYRTLSDALAAHRQWHLHQFFKEVIRQALRHKSVPPMFTRFLAEAA
ncbi:MAG: transposase [Armatimonadota bacterium]|nr:transposase [Armatimonadota bacterium]